MDREGDERVLIQNTYVVDLEANMMGIEMLTKYPSISKRIRMGYGVWGNIEKTQIVRAIRDIVEKIV